MQFGDLQYQPRNTISNSTQSNNNIDIKLNTFQWTTGNILGAIASIIICGTILMIFVICIIHTFKKKLNFLSREQPQQNVGRDVRVILNSNIAIPPIQENPPPYDQALYSPNVSRKSIFRDEISKEILPSYDDVASNSEQNLYTKSAFKILSKLKKSKNLDVNFWVTANNLERKQNSDHLLDQISICSFPLCNRHYKMLQMRNFTNLLKPIILFNKENDHHRINTLDTTQSMHKLFRVNSLCSTIKPKHKTIQRSTSFN
ncbi:uncharacterized protein LOC135931063 isoform X2 [Gordionus sp. m RMFG-2023]|uniref:uncharacterized protein LOC135931063 isoform X2 n=1 Tax=Gordionus sp. m RMFG-2023 TaxID=3053472 RepID=UPI0031FD743A